ncbi:hypothetical protein [Xanthomonas sp. LMG 12461]|uniref:hypothetical protein n=1 Tax=Xanthomonas sp. LMG 12461 TaxID=2014543 RepID=UPI0012650603|nr:hypothetical protein [Xanthomonas sp. LMG 12461]
MRIAMSRRLLLQQGRNDCRHAFCPSRFLTPPIGFGRARPRRWTAWLAHSLGSQCDAMAIGRADLLSPSSPMAVATPQKSAVARMSLHARTLEIQAFARLATSVANAARAMLAKR